MFKSRHVRCTLLVGLLVSTITSTTLLAQSKTSTVKAKPTYSELLATAAATDWRALDLENTLYMDLPTGRVVIELNAAYAPAHADNIRALVREG